MSVRKWLNDLDEIEHRLAAAGRELQIAESELSAALSSHNIVGFRMIVSETAQASLEYRKSAASVEKLRAQREEVDAFIQELNKGREQLLRRISAPAASSG